MQRFLALLLTLLVGASACTASTTTTTDTADSADSADASEATSVDESESDEDEPAEAPTAAPTATPEPTATPAPTATPEPAADETSDEDMQATAMLEQSALGAELSPSEIACVVKGLAAEPALLANAISGVDFEDLSLDDKIDTSLIALDCAPEAAAAQFTNEFTDSFAETQPEQSAELGECLMGQLSKDNPDRRNVLLGFASLDEELPIPVDAQGALVDSISTCVPGPVFADMMIAEFADDPAMANAIDTECIRGAFPDETMRQFWGAMVTSGGSMDDVDLEATSPLMNSLFACMSMGQVMADQAALSGTVLSDESITCIDTELAGGDLAAMMAGDDAEGEARITAIVIGCLSPEELAGLAG